MFVPGSSDVEPASPPLRLLKRVWRKLGWKLVLFACVAAGSVALGWWIEWRLHDPSRATRPFRVAYRESPPYQHVMPDGSPGGPAIEIFAEACRRRHIPIVWVPIDPTEEAGPNMDAIFLNGKVDLKTMVVDMPERRKFIYISDPWISLSFWMVSREDRGIFSPKDTAGRLVAHESFAP